MAGNPLRNVPSVGELLDSAPLRRLLDRVSRNVVVAEVRSFVDNLRGELQTAAAEIKLPTAGELAERIAHWIVTDRQPPLRSVINATGILLSSGLGRSPLAEEALQEIISVAGGYASLEIDLTTGDRALRVQAAEKLLKEQTGAEAALVANSHEGALLWALSALAAGCEVLVARSQLAETGNGCRLSELVAYSGAQLREVGAANLARVGDYETALSDRTAAILRADCGDYVVAGLAEQPSLAELVALGRRKGVPVIDALGPGALLDFTPYGLTGVPQARGSILAGADLVLINGDQLLGGPQCGIITGRAVLLQQLAAHPLARVICPDKLTLAALAATLRLYRDPQVAERSIPLLSLLGTSVDNLQNRAERLAPQLAAVRAVAQAEPLASVAWLSGEGIPSQQLPSWCVAVAPAGRSVEQLAGALRRATPAIVGRTSPDRLLLDLRSVLPAQDMRIAEVFAALAGHASPAAADG